MAKTANLKSSASSKMNMPAKFAIAGQGDYASMLKQAGVRPTKQRLAVADLLFSKGNRHVTVDQVFNQSREAGLKLSLATVYNCLNQFRDSGLLREVITGGRTSYFDTNLDPHHHFYHVNKACLYDVNASEVELLKLPNVPQGTKLDGVEVVIKISDQDA